MVGASWHHTPYYYYCYCYYCYYSSCRATNTTQHLVVCFGVVVFCSLPEPPGGAAGVFVVVFSVVASYSFFPQPGVPREISHTQKVGRL
jgi:hypothetical protein